jgi:hypothetical protein
MAHAKHSSDGWTPSPDPEVQLHWTVVENCWELWSAAWAGWELSAARFETAEIGRVVDSDARHSDISAKLKLISKLGLLSRSIGKVLG